MSINSLVIAYKSLSMQDVIKSITKFSFENLIVFIYGEKGTEKDYLIEIILRHIPGANVVKIHNELSKRNILSRQENMVYIIRNFENMDISFLFNEKNFRCAIFVSDSDYEQLYKDGRISFELKETLSKAQKLYIPPLRERKQDIIPLADFFLYEIAEFLGLPKKELSREAKNAVFDYPWTGNAYQLKRYLTRAFILTRHQKLTSKDLFGEYTDKLSIKSFLELKIGNLLKDFVNIENSNLYDTVIQEVEKALFSLALDETGGNQVKASKILGINRNTLKKKLKHYNLI